MPKRTKPAGIAFIAMFSALLAATALAVACTRFSFFGVLIAIAGVLFLVAAYGLGALRAWGRGYTWWLYVAFLPLCAIAVFSGFASEQLSIANTVFPLLGIAIDIAVLLYLGRPEVMALFGEAEGPYFAYARREPYIGREPQ